MAIRGQFSRITGSGLAIMQFYLSTHFIVLLTAIIDPNCQAIYFIVYPIAYKPQKLIRSFASYPWLFFYLMTLQEIVL